LIDVKPKTRQSIPQCAKSARIAVKFIKRIDALWPRIAKWLMFGRYSSVSGPDVWRSSLQSRCLRTQFLLHRINQTCCTESVVFYALLLSMRNPPYRLINSLLTPKACV
jgi:hypothetical protein